jgi:hypothetical protein
MRLIEHKCRIFLLVTLLWICLNLFALGQSKNPTEQVSHPVQLATATRSSDSRPAGVFPESVLVFVQEEPLVLLLIGLALFAGATTLRRKRSGNREQTTGNAETSI